MKLTRSLLEMSVIVAFIGIAILPGCGPTVKVDPKANTSPVLTGKEQVKERLKAIASSGSGGSATGGVRDALIELKKTEAPLADQLLQDLAKLEQLQDSAQIKALANAMVAKL